MFVKCRNFMVRELVDKKTFDRFGEYCWMFFSPQALITIDNIREYFDKPVTVNDWVFGGNKQFRGFRPWWCVEGSEYSQHRLGRAWDFDVKGLTAEEVREEILRKKNHPAFQRITCIEADTWWVHVDVRNIPDTDRIRIVYP